MEEAPAKKERKKYLRPSRATKTKKVQRSQKARFVEADIVSMLKLYHMEKQTIKSIAEKFKCSRQYVTKLLKKHDNPLTEGGVMVMYNPNEVMGRAGLDPFRRAKLLSEDSMQVCEIAIHLIKHELTCLSMNLKDGGSLKEQGIDTEKFIDKLTKFFSTAAPYAIERKDGKTVPDATPESQLHKKMMAMTLPLQKAN